MHSMALVTGRNRPEDAVSSGTGRSHAGNQALIHVARDAREQNPVRALLLINYGEFPRATVSALPPDRASGSTRPQDLWPPRGIALADFHRRCKGQPEALAI